MRGRLAIGASVVVMLGGGSPGCDASSPAPAPQPGSAPEAEAPEVAASDPVGCPEGMNLVAGGTFPPDLAALLQPGVTTPVVVADYCLDRTEATLGAWFACSFVGGCPPGGDRRFAACDRNPEDCQRSAVEVIHRDITQARAFCAFRGGRVQTVAEFYWAALGGEQRRPYPWGTAEPTVAHLNACDADCLEAARGDCGGDWSTERCDAMVGSAKGLLEGSDGAAGIGPAGGWPAGAGRWGQLDLQGNASEWADDEGGVATCGVDATARELPAATEVLPCAPFDPAAHPDEQPWRAIRCAADPR